MAELVATVLLLTCFGAVTLMLVGAVIILAREIWRS